MLKNDILYNSVYHIIHWCYIYNQRLQWKTEDLLDSSDSIVIDSDTLRPIKTDTIRVNHNLKDDTEDVKPKRETLPNMDKPSKIEKNKGSQEKIDELLDQKRNMLKVIEEESEEEIKNSAPVFGLG